MHRTITIIILSLVMAVSGAAAARTLSAGVPAAMPVCCTSAMPMVPDLARGQAMPLDCCCPQNSDCQVQDQTQMVPILAFSPNPMPKTPLHGLDCPAPAPVSAQGREFYNSLRPLAKPPPDPIYLTNSSLLI